MRATLICRALATSMMVSMYTSKEPEHRNAYARARHLRLEKWIDEMVPMIDKIIGEEMSVVMATRNAVDVRKWVASRLMPNQYGDQPSGVTINNQTNIVMVSEERQKGIASSAPTHDRAAKRRVGVTYPWERGAEQT